MEEKQMPWQMQKESECPRNSTDADARMMLKNFIKENIERPTKVSCPVHVFTGMKMGTW